MRSVAIVWPKCKIYSFKRVSPCLVFVVLTAVGTAAHFAGTPGYARPGAPPLSHVQHPTCRSCTETALTMQRASMQVSLQSAVLLKSPGERLLITHKEIAGTVSYVVGRTEHRLCGVMFSLHWG
jgi:hypothetical protein